MRYLVGILMMLVSLLYGYLCLASPLGVLRALARWPRFVFGRLVPNIRVHSSLTDALAEIDSFRPESSPRIRAALGIIRTTGLVAMLIAAGFCCLMTATAIGLE